MTFNGTEAPRQLQHNRDQVKYWRYVVETWHGKTYLGIFKVKPNENGETVMTDLHHAIQRLKTGKAFGNLDRTLPFWVPVVEDGVLSSNSTTDLESQQDTCRVFVTDRKPNVELTHAFRNPRIFVNAPEFSNKFPQFEIGTSHNITKNVLVVGLKLSRFAVLLLVLANLLFSLLVGVFVGLRTRRVELGVTAASAVVTLSCGGTSIFLKFRTRRSRT